MSWIEDVGLGMLGLTDAQKAQVEAAMPQIEDAVAVLQANQALLQQVALLYAQAEPMITSLAKDWKVAGPAVQILADALRKQQQNYGHGK